MQNTVSFKVSGTELSEFMQRTQKKSEEMSSSAIAGAIEQTKKSKEQLKVIEDQIKAIEKKNKLEQDAVQSILNKKKESALDSNSQHYENERTKLADLKKKGQMTPEGYDNAVNQTYKNEKEAKAEIRNEHRETLAFQKEENRQSKMQTQFAKDNIDAIKQTAKENIKAIVNGDLKLSDVIKSAQTDDQQLVARLTEEGLKDEKKRQDKEGGGGKGVMSGMLAVDNINRLISSAGQFASTNNGFDLIKPAASSAGRIIGGIIGGILGTLIEPGGGTMIGAGIGASLGGSIGEAGGELLSRKAIAGQDYYRAKGRWEGITGSELKENPNMQEVGVSSTDFIKLSTDYARRLGNSGNASNTAREALYADRGYGVDQNTSGLIVEMQRSAREVNKNLAELIGGVLQKGNGTIFRNGDHTFLNEFLGKFTTLQKELLKTQTNVATGTTMDILTRFNKMGGEFSATDSRSQGNISAIQAGLANPGTDNLKALSFSVLRRQMPNAGIFDILKEREKGLGSPAYLKGMLGMIDQLGGDDQSKKLNLSGMFGGLSKSAVERLFDNRKDLMSGDLSIEELKSTYKGDFQTKAEANTPDIDKNQAKIQDGLLGGMYETIEAMGDAFVTAIKESMSGAVISVENGKITFPAKGAIIKANATKTAADQRKFQEFIMSEAGYDQNGNSSDPYSSR